MSNIQGQEAPQVQFIEPEPSSIEDFAALACQTLAVQVGSAFASPEVIDGFSHMLQITAQIGAQLFTKLMNDELRDIFEWNEGLHAHKLAQKTVFRAVRWYVPNTKRIMVLHQPSRNVLRMRGGERDEYDQTA